MRVIPVVQAATSLDADTVHGTLRQLLQRGRYEHIQVAMAYVSIAGARTFLQCCSHIPTLRTEWLVGLDDLVTQPGAIDLVRGLPRTNLRVAALGARPQRFHPKVCRFQSSQCGAPQLVMVGSANLTQTALTGNSESVVFLESESNEEHRTFEQIWQAVWTQGHAPSLNELAQYQTRYTAARPLRHQIRDLQPTRAGRQGDTRAILQRDSAELDPALAEHCWIECGRVTAMGRELELKAEQGLFFDLDSSVTNESTFRFRVSDGTVISLRLRYQQNAMWRVQMNNEVPEVRSGLRPVLGDGRLGRSELVAVFSRTDTQDEYELRFLRNDSREFATLKDRSAQLGTSSRTRTGPDGRDYGWC